MLVIKVLKRKDASSVVLAIVIGSLLLQFVQTVTNYLAIKISHVNYGTITYHWKQELLLPAVWLVLGLVALELVCWIYVWVTMPLKKK